ncbi:hypothetical protein FDECE_8867 [Fusarium decemcellulare]|nr:hypothetical protein FDECE_8867 [Fusarium decemcellulare]
MESQSLAAQSPQQATGLSALWILGTLAAAAVMLPSTYSQRIGQDLFSGKLDLLRSFPGVCLFDAVIDLAVLCKAVRQGFSATAGGIHTWRGTLSKLGVVMLKLAVFILLVLPQVIKVFNMQDIPATQFCASLFFFAVTTRLIVQLSGVITDEHYLAGQDGAELAMPFVLLGLLLYIGQATVELWIWWDIGSAEIISLPQDMDFICLCLHLACNLAMLMQMLIWLAHIVAHRRLDIATAPYKFPMVGLFILATVLGVREKPVPRRKESRSAIPAPPIWMHHFNYVTGLMFCAAIFSILLANALDASRRLVTQETEAGLITHEPSAGQKTGQKAGQGNDAHGEPSSNQSAAIVEPSETEIKTLSGRIDSQLFSFFTPHSAASGVISLTVFNIITTMLYYFVCFDRTRNTDVDSTSIEG